MKRLAPGSCLLLLLFPLAVAAQESGCNAKGVSTTVKAYLAGFADTDSVTVGDIIKSGKLKPGIAAWQIIGFTWSESGTCIGPGFFQSQVHSDSFSAKDTSVIRILNPGTTIFFDCILAKNAVGTIYQLSCVSYKIRRQQ